MTIGQCPLIALGIFGAAAHFEAVLVLDLLRRERAFLTAEQYGQGHEHQRYARACAYSSQPVTRKVRDGIGISEGHALLKDGVADESRG
jgi:hypothetical protein